MNTITATTTHFPRTTGAHSSSESLNVTIVVLEVVYGLVRTVVSQPRC